MHVRALVVLPFFLSPVRAARQLNPAQSALDSAAQDTRDVLGQQRSRGMPATVVRADRGLAYPMLAATFSRGREMKTAPVDEHSQRGVFTREREIGPSLPFRTLRRHSDLALPVGLGGASRAADLFPVLGRES